jgi:hypothetical protein
MCSKIAAETQREAGNLKAARSRPGIPKAAIRPNFNPAESPLLTQDGNDAEVVILERVPKFRILTRSNFNQPKFSLCNRSLF